MHYMTFDLVCVTVPPGTISETLGHIYFLRNLCKKKRTNQSTFDFLRAVMHFLLTHIDQIKAKAYTINISIYSMASSSNSVNDKLSSLHFHHTWEEVRKNVHPHFHLVNYRTCCENLIKKWKMVFNMLLLVTWLI